MRAAKTSSLMLSILILSACQSIPKDAFKLSETNLEQRQLQTRTFEDIDETAVLSASAAVVQDLGYTIDESETAIGLISASKVADATNAAQVAGAVVLALLGGGATPVDDEQHIRFSLVALPEQDVEDTYSVRITLQRVIYNTQGNVTKSEMIQNEEVYVEFFDKLSKAVFLEQNL